MNDELNITFDELMKIVNNYKRPNVKVTEEQKEFLIKSREKNISYPVITKLWNKMQDWPKLTESSIRRRYSKLSENE
jgi:hypothetical protein